MGHGLSAGQRARVRRSRLDECAVGPGLLLLAGCIHDRRRDVAFWRGWA
jgi:hypothetical protein